MKRKEWKCNTIFLPVTVSLLVPLFSSSSHVIARAGGDSSRASKIAAKFIERGNFILYHWLVVGELWLCRACRPGIDQVKSPRQR